MGLDAVELIFEVEEAFGVNLDDASLENIRTVGDLYDYILQERVKIPPFGCPTSAVFYSLRRVLLAHLPITKREIRPSTPLAEFLPQNARRKLWSKIRLSPTFNAGRLPSLQLPVILQVGMLTVVGGLLIAFFDFWMWQIGFTLALTLTFATAIPICLVTFFATRPFATALPSGVMTVGDLTRRMFPKNFEKTIRDQRDWSDAQIWDKLQRLISDQLGVPIEKIEKRTSFVNDLEI